LTPDSYAVKLNTRAIPLFTTMTFMADPCDEALINHVLTDPDQGWREFQSKYGAFIKTLIRRHRLSTEDSEEIYQEVCLRLVKHDHRVLRAWEPARCPLKGYLVVITESVCLNFLRSSFHKYNQLRISPAGNDLDLDTVLSENGPLAPTPADRILRFETLRIFRDCLDSWCVSGFLSADDRLLIELRIGGMTWDQVSEVVGIPSATVRSRLSRMKRELRQRLIVRGLEV